MARILTTGFETGDLLQAADTSYAAASATNPHTGTYAMRVQPAGFWYVPYTRWDVTAASEYYLRTWIYWDEAQNPPLYPIWWTNGTTVLGHLGINSDGTLTAHTGGTLWAGGTQVAATAASMVPAYTWKMIELHVVIADAGSIQVRVDGNLLIDYNGDTKPGSNTTINRFYLTSGARTTGSYGATIDYDDLALNDTTGAADNSWPGDGRVIALMPVGAGTYTDMTPSTGANWQCVDERPPSSADYVQGNVVDMKDSYTVAASGLSDVTILRAWVEVRSAKDQPDTGINIATFLRTNETDYQGDDQAIYTDYRRFASAEYTTNPQTLAGWTVAEVDAAEVGQVAR